VSLVSRPPDAPSAARLLAPALVLVALLGVGCGRVAPSYEPATLTVRSTPAGAVIVIDGQQTGQVTPFTFTGVSAEAHQVSVTLAEWHADPEVIPVDLRPLDDVAVDFALFQTGVQVTSEPAGARILVDGTDSGKVTPATVAGLQSGTVHISLELDTWLCVPASVAVDVVDGSVAEVTPQQLQLRSRRTVMLESFGNVNCGTCAQAAGNLLSLCARDGYGPGRALFVEYSVSWPNPTDPMYLANPTENAERYTFYWVMATPLLLIDGVAQPDALDPVGPVAAVAGRWDVDPGFLVDVDASPGGGAAVPVTVSLTPLRNVDLTGCSLYVALYEDLVTYATPPGTNGQSEFHHVFRDRVDAPPALGALVAGTPATFEVTLNRGAADPANVTVIAFVQRTADKTVLQAGSTAATVKFHRP
jgi:hypothetical protein